MRKGMYLFPIFGFFAFGCLTTLILGDEEPAISDEGSVVSIQEQFSDSDKEELKKNAEKHKFEAEVNRLMDIIINSLYGQKEVFLRELVSNAADALEKARFLSIADPTYLQSNPNFEIRIEADEAAKTVTIQDTGVGMTKQELVNNLGTVARSGTTNFLEALAGGQDLNLIGQFGVGFYSCFLVSDKVTVVSKSYSDPVQHVWESTADGAFTVAPDPRGNTLGRGTRVVLHLKDDSTKFLTPDTLIKTVTKFNQFVNFPIYVKTIKREVEEVPLDTKIEGDLEEYPHQDEPAEGEEKTTKKVFRKMRVWEHVNKQKPIWLRPKESVEEAEYNQFYKEVLKDYQDPVAYIHFTGEGEVEFKSILFIPRAASSDDWESFFNSKQGSIKLYSRRVLVADESYELVPKWLSFLKGVVDSDDLPLKVDRESFAQTKMMSVITKKIVAKFVEMAKKLSREDKEAWDKYREEVNDPEKNATVPDTKFGKFWQTFGKNLKMGCIEDSTHREKIAPLFKWHTTVTTLKDSITLDEYVARMPAEQKEILFVAHDNFDSALRLPHVQLYRKKGWELIVAHDPLDETCLQKIKSFRTKAISSVEKTSVKPALTDDEKKRFKKIEKAFKPLTTFLQSRLGSKIGRVQVSQKLVDDPAAITTDSFGMGAYTERVVKSQTFATYSSEAQNRYRVLELNPNHPLITRLRDMVEADKQDPQAEAVADLLLETAMLASGFSIENPTHLVNRLIGSLRQDAGVPSDAVVEEFVVSEEDTADDEDTTTATKSEDEFSEFDDEPAAGESKSDENVHDEL